MASELSSKKAILFIDGQNLFYAAKEAFGYTYPNYDVRLPIFQAGAKRV